jgi:hypothetical protein
LRSRQLCKSLYDADDTIKGSFPDKNEDDNMEHKSEDSSFFGYKTHIAMSDERIITAATVASGDKGDGP